ncbi:MAG: CehA/McbA family metallohydrolase [Mycobacterium leprae]
MMITLTRDLTIAAQQQGQSFSVPFTMPDGIRRMEVASSWEAPDNGRATIDLGCESHGRLLGFSPGSRDGFFVESTRSTPGFEPGPLTPGPWAVVLQAYRVPPGGVKVTLKIRLLPPQPQWFRGDFHHHTHHSDAAHSVATVLEMAEDARLDFVALTDHNTVAQNRVVCESSVLAIPGTEVTSPQGHMNILGATGVVDYRYGSIRDLAAPLAAVHSAGGLAVINHPFRDDSPWTQEWDFDWDLLEVWNETWAPRNQLTLDWWQKALAKGRHIPVVGGSDMHSVNRFAGLRTGTPTTYVYADGLTVPDILAAAKAGRSFISDSPEGPATWLTVDGHLPGESVSRGQHTVEVKLERAEECQLRLIGPAGALRSFDLPRTEGDATFQWSWNAADGEFVRAELWTQDSRLLRALTNPVYVA